MVSWTDISQSGADTSSSAIRAQVFNADGSKSGGEFLVNTITSGSQLNSDITALADGRFVISWSDHFQSFDDPSFGGIRAQVFNADGSKSGGEFLVNTTTYDSQTQSAVTALTDGRFVISWSDASSSDVDGSLSAIRAQAFNGDGSKSGGELVVNTATTDSQYESDITALADGRFVVCWADDSLSADDSSGSAIRAQVFNADGSKSGGEFLVNTTTTGSQDLPTITALADGRLVVSWRDASSSADDLSGYAIRAQIFDPREVAITLTGTAAADDFVGTRFSDVIRGSLGNDTLTGAGGDDTLRGNDGSDRLRGNGGNDVLRGGVGNDILNGGHGNDTLNGGAGDDTMTGGAGADRFVFASDYGTADVTDFVHTTDKLDLSAYDFTGVDQAKSFAADAGDDVVFIFAADNVLTIDNIAKAELTADDFIL